MKSRWIGNENRKLTFSALWIMSHRARAEICDVIFARALDVLMYDSLFLMEVDVRQSIQCPGFQAAGLAAGIKKKHALDLGLIFSRQPAAAAGVFTRNRVQAAPVRLTRRHLDHGGAQAVIVNSGNANCCTGNQGEADARQMAFLVASRLGIPPEAVMVASTGVIGAPMPMDAIERAVPGLAEALRPDGFDDFAHSIMTTDTVPKLIRREGSVDGRPFNLVVAAKGAGMIRPDMATMLCFVCTDAAAGAPLLQQCLNLAVDRSLNRITIDGDTSTNDMVLILANGQSGVEIRTAAQQDVFQALLEEALMETARSLIRDGEGVTKVVEIVVKGAGSDADARRVADTVAHSPLVKTAFFGQDANWGRIIAAVGRAGVDFAPDRIDIYFDTVRMVAGGEGCGLEAEARATAVLKRPEFSVVIDLNQGNGTAWVLTGDFSVDYVKINADYRS
jgi:glutamate N-acetyltransferase/amino-acid N-acetyltransferase